MFWFRKVVGAATAAALMSAGALVTMAAPASAAYTAAVQIDFAKPKIVGQFGDYLSLSGGSVKIQKPDGTWDSPMDGEAYLQRLTPGSSTWTTVDTDTDPGYLYLPNVDKFTGTAAYRVLYSGGSYTYSDQGEVTYPETTSATSKVYTLFKVDLSETHKGSRTYANIKVVPKGVHPVKVQIKLSGAWKKYASVKTNSKGQVLVRITKFSRKGQPYRLIVAGDKKCTATTVGFVARSY